MKHVTITPKDYTGIDLIHDMICDIIEECHGESVESLESFSIEVSYTSVEEREAKNEMASS
jgi:hypothetical protein